MPRIPNASVIADGVEATLKCIELHAVEKAYAVLSPVVVVVAAALAVT